MQFCEFEGNGGIMK